MASKLLVGCLLSAPVSPFFSKQTGEMEQNKKAIQA